MAYEDKNSRSSKAKSRFHNQKMVSETHEKVSEIAREKNPEYGASEENINKKIME